MWKIMLLATLAATGTAPHVEVLMGWSLANHGSAVYLQQPSVVAQDTGRLMISAPFGEVDCVQDADGWQGTVRFRYVTVPCTEVVYLSHDRVHVVGGDPYERPFIEVLGRTTL